MRGRSISETGPVGVEPVVSIDELSEPGTYLSCWTGHLIRVRRDRVSGGAPAGAGIAGGGPGSVFVAKLSSDPRLARSEARRRAARMDLPVSF